MNDYLKMILLEMLLLFSCSNNSLDEINNVSPELYEFDKKTIAEAYLKNIEYYRLYYPYDLEYKIRLAVQELKDTAEERLLTEKLDRHYAKYPKAKEDCASLYKPHACRFSLIINDYVCSPIPTKKQVFVSTDSIIYNKDATLCIAFLCIEDKYDDIEGLKKVPHTFNAEALIGYRKQQNDTLKTYPLTIFRLRRYDEKKSIVDDLIKLYTTKLKGTILSWSIYGNNRFIHNVGEKGFFEESPLFQKYNDSIYCFQMYRALGKDYPYDYPY